MKKIEILFRALLKGPMTGLEISQKIKTTCSSTIASDLRKKGCHILRELIGYTGDGSPINRYTLLSWPKGLYGVGL